MPSRYTAFESVEDDYTLDTFAFSANQHNLDVVAEEVTPDRGHIYPKTSKGRTARAQLNGPLSWTGNIETLMYTQGAPTLFYYALGNSSTATDSPTNGVNKHTVTTADTIKQFIMATGRDLREHQYVSTVATGFSMDFAPGDPVSADFAINARKELPNQPRDTTTVTFPDYDAAERTFSGVEMNTKMGPAEGGSPTSVITVESANISYENNFEDGAYVLGDQHLSGNFVNAIDITGSIEFSYATIDDYNDVVSDTAKELNFLASHGSAAAVRGYEFKFPRISYDTASIPTTDAERYVQSVDWTAADNAAGNAMTAIFTNDESAAEFTA